MNTAVVTLRVGVVGVGAMGLAMAQRLRDGGHTVVVHDVDRVRAALALEAGCTAADDATAAACGSVLLIVAVVDAAQTRAVLFDPAHGAVTAMQPGHTVLLCPTIGPADTEAIAGELLARGIEVLDAPMSGGPDRARDGTMSLMVAGADATFARHEALLRHLASRLFRVGTRPGDGARTKLVNNLLAAVNLAGAAEALALAERLGLDAAATLAVIEQSSGQSWIGSDRLHRALAGDTVVKARIALLAKDSALALAMARGLPGEGPELALGRAAGEVFAGAVRDGLADEDDANLGRWMAQPGPR